MQVHVITPAVVLDKHLSNQFLLFENNLKAVKTILLYKYT